MYAIRSYYEVGVKELMQFAAFMLGGFAHSVITSYSIHYTKLYEDGRTSEAAIKYFLMGGFASALLLFGFSLLYGLLGTTDIARMAELVSGGALVASPLLLAALGLIIAGFSFKVAAAPFHLWTPDVYEGAPTIVTAFMSVGPKAAGFAIFGRVLFLGLSGLQAP